MILPLRHSLLYSFVSLPGTFSPTLIVAPTLSLRRPFFKGICKPLKKHQTYIMDFTNTKVISFHFNPRPFLPRQTSLGAVPWVAVLTMYELTTLVTQIESMLNSRPITALSNDLTYCTAMTPAHFLIRVPFNAIHEPILENLLLNRLKRWHLVQALKQRLWKRLPLQYLHTLQQLPQMAKTLTTVRIDIGTQTFTPFPMAFNRNNEASPRTWWYSTGTPTDQTCSQCRPLALSH